jgi:hypothetical protein
MRTRGEQARRRRRAPLVAALTAAALAAVAALALAAAAPSKPIVLSDATGDVSGTLDIQRASLRRTTDGRLRAVITFAAQIAPKSMLAKTGPPGSACLRIWTAPDADPRAMRPDHLVCVTPDRDDKLRAGVFEQRDAGLPRRIDHADVTTNASGRSIAVRFAHSALGRPALIRFAIESTRPGCERVSCIDTVPDRGVTRRFRLRSA